MANNLKNDFIDKVSDKGGAVRLTTSGNVAVATALDTMVREVIIQAATANTSNCIVALNEAASATNGIVVPQAIGTVEVAGSLRLGVASLTMVQIYAAEDGDIVDMVWRN